MKSSEYQFSMTVRDVELLRYLFATKGAIGKQIHRDIFGNVTPQAMTRRLRALGKAGLIERGSVYMERPTPVYFVTKRALRSGIIYDFDLPRMEAKSSNITHELSLVDIRHKCRSLEGLKHYLTENELQTELWGGKNYSFKDYLRLNSDGFLRVQIGKKIFSGAIEYEQSEKGKTRYESLLSEYYLSPDISFVFYIVSERRILESIFRHDNDVRGNRKSIIFGATLDHFLSRRDLVSLENSLSRKIELPLRDHQ